MNKNIKRLVQTFVILAVALYATLVCFGNLVDYNSNFDFVKHVLAMDTTFDGNSLMWRAIDSHFWQTVAYWAIIVTEGLIAILAWVAGIKMLRNMKSTAAKFSHAKYLGYFALLLGLALWFVGFVGIGSEWFAMWQSDIWNGKQTAMDITAVLGVFLVIYMLPSTEEK